MKILEVDFRRRDGQGAFVENAELILRDVIDVGDGFEPLCLVGRNGSGKSHFLQAVAEAFQAAWHACSPEEERVSHDNGMDFRIQYLIQVANGPKKPLIVELLRSGASSKRKVTVRTKATDDYEWTILDNGDMATRSYLPQRVVAYTSGDNETLSVPFFASSLAYGDQVTKQARARPQEQALEIPEPRLLLIDYVTHLELLVANLLFGSEDHRRTLLRDVGLADLRSFRCVIQRKGIDLTPELKTLIDRLSSCSTTWAFNPETEVFIFDFWVDEATRQGFKTWCSVAFDCYRAFHKLSLLNALGVSQAARERFRSEVRGSRFAARLPEPPDENKVFKFEQVMFSPNERYGDVEPVDYVALSDGEHQLVQLLGTFSMIDEPNVLFLLDEAESHFNPRWRVELMSMILDIPTATGTRRGEGASWQQDALLTTHAPFVPSDMPRERVLIFERLEDGQLSVRRPDIQTFGASYEEILQSCFGVYPPISRLPQDEIDKGMASEDPVKIRSVLKELGPSVEKAILNDHLRAVIRERQNVLPASD